MSDSLKLIALKTIHTLIWLFFNLVLVYLFFAVMTNQVDYRFWIGIGLIGIECTILILNKWTCPLTPLARKYSDSNMDNFDIYLPNWLAKYNKTIYSIIMVILIIIYMVRIV